jgi:hypothetical protein
MEERGVCRERASPIEEGVIGETMESRRERGTSEASSPDESEHARREVE